MLRPSVRALLGQASMQQRLERGMGPERTSVDRVIDRLRDRASIHRHFALAYFVLIVLSLAIGAPLFVFAGSITARDGAALREQLRWEAAFQEKHVEKIVAKSGAGEAGSDAWSESSAAEPIEVQPRLASITPQSPNENAAGTVVVDYVALSTMVIRAGLVLLLVFVVQALAGLYKFSMRLASHYGARADALRMLESGDDERELERLIALLSPRD